MNIKDYKNAVSRMHAKPELKAEVLEMSVERKKKKYSKRAVIPIAIAATVGLSACTLVFADDIARIFRKTDNFEMNIATEETVEKKNTTVSVKTVVPKKWDEGVIKKLFLNGKTTVDYLEYPGEINPETYKRVYEFDDNSWFIYENGYLYYEYGDRKNYSYSLATSSFQLKNRDKTSGDPLFKNGDIDGLDKNKCIAIADNYIKELGITVKGKETYALDKDGLIKTDIARNANGERIDKHEEILPEWTEEQEAYLIVYDPCIDDVSVDEFSCNYEVIVGRNGLISIEMSTIYEPCETVDNVEICSSEEAADSIYKYFKAAPPPSSTKIENCRLAYIPFFDKEKNNYLLKPYWEFYSTEFQQFLTDAGKMTDFEHGSILIVDAQTGEFDIEKNLSHIMFSEITP